MHPTFSVMTGNDQHGIRGIDHQPGGEPTFREEAANAVDAAGSTSLIADADQGPQQRTGGVFRH
jgi:hypothetical protein